MRKSGLKSGARFTFWRHEPDGLACIHRRGRCSLNSVRGENGAKMEESKRRDEIYAEEGEFLSW